MIISSSFLNLKKKGLTFSSVFVLSITSLTALDPAYAGYDDLALDDFYGPIAVTSTSPPSGADEDRETLVEAEPLSPEGREFYSSLKIAARDLTIPEALQGIGFAQNRYVKAGFKLFKEKKYHKAIVTMLPLWDSSIEPPEPPILEDSYLLAFLCHKGKSLTPGDHGRMLSEDPKVKQVIQNLEKIYMALALDHLASVTSSDIRKEAAQRLALELYAECNDIAARNEKVFRFCRQKDSLQRILAADSLEERLSVGRRFFLHQ